MQHINLISFPTAQLYHLGKYCQELYIYYITFQNLCNRFIINPNCWFFQAAVDRILIHCCTFLYSHISVFKELYEKIPIDNPIDRIPYDVKKISCKKASFSKEVGLKSEVLFYSSESFSNASATSAKSLRIGRCCGQAFSHLPHFMQSDALRPSEV